MFEHVVELHVVDVTCKNVRESETPDVFIVKTRMWGETPRQQKKIKKKFFLLSFVIFISFL